MNVPYITGSSPPPELPIGRFLPPLPAGMVRSWCQNNLRPGEWVLEPFGYNPLIPIEIAQAGHPVLVTVNNPILSFLLKIVASAPQEGELIAALQDMAVVLKGEERMEAYIRSFYMVNCILCQRKIEAEAFLWKKGEENPYASIVNCPFCGAHGEQLLDEENLAGLKPLPAKRLHQARALNRIADVNDSLRVQVENALNTYPTRPLVILQTLINRLETLDISQRRKDLLTALILSAADQGNTLWAYPSPRDRPRQIVIPSVYKEKNLWKVLEKAIKTWQVLDKSIPLTDWEGLPDAPEGIYRFQGRLKELQLNAHPDLFSAVITAIPRPNQAFWTLSALWTGWIWGQDAVDPIRQVLSRQRYDWNWHTNALSGIFSAIQEIPKASKIFMGLIAENEPMLLLSALLAGDQANFKLSNFAVSIDDQIAQCQWMSVPPKISPRRIEEATELAQQKAADYLKEKGEPASYQQVHTAIAAGLANDNSLALDNFLENPNQAASEIQKWIESIFQFNAVLTAIDGESSSVETKTWWLTHPSDLNTPLIDRVEEEIVRHLVQTQTTTAKDIKDRVNQAFPGLYTPADRVVLNCLESYADLIDEKTHTWKLRDTEQPAARIADIKAIKSSLNQIAERLNFRISGEDPILWISEDNSEVLYGFHILASSIISKHFHEGQTTAQNNILILPGSRANLLAFKEQRNPLIKQMLGRDFLVVKFRLIRDLEANPLLSRELLKEQIRVDPPEYRSSQLALF